MMKTSIHRHAAGGFRRNPWAVILLGGLLAIAAARVSAQESVSPPGLSDASPARDATQEQRVKSLQEEAARDLYLSVRPALSRWLGLAVFFTLCLILIYFLDRKIRQRDHLRRIGFYEPPSHD